MIKSGHDRGDRDNWKRAHRRNEPRQGRESETNFTLGKRRQMTGLNLIEVAIPSTEPRRNTGRGPVTTGIVTASGDGEPSRLVSKRTWFWGRWAGGPDPVHGGPSRARSSDLLIS